MRTAGAELLTLDHPAIGAYQALDVRYRLLD